MDRERNPDNESGTSGGTEPRITPFRELQLMAQDVGRYGSAIDVTTELVDFRFTFSGIDTVYTIWPQIVACLSAASMNCAGGATLAFSAVLIPQLQRPDSEIKVNKSDISWIASVVPLVIPLGALVTGYLVDKIGRVKTVLLGAVPYIVGWICIALAENLAMLLLGRVLTGFSAAMAINAAIIYVTEISRPDLRGALVCMGPTFTSLGMIAIYFSGAFLYWRTISWVSMVYCLFPIFFTCLWAPESPAWLISKGKNLKAHNSLNFLLRGDRRESLVESQLAQLVMEHNIRQGITLKTGSPIKNLIRGLAKPTGYKPLILITILFVFQQFTGVYITIFYSVSFFEEVAGDVDPYLSSVAVGLIRLFIGFLTAVLMKPTGIRPLFLISGIGVFIFLIIAGYMTKQIEEGNMEPSIIPEICVLMYMSLAVIGLLTIPWIISAELYPLEIRGMAQGLTIAIAHLIMFCALKIYPFLTDMLGGMHGVLWMFAGVSFIAVIFVFIFLPETKNRQLMELQDYFQSHTIYILSKNKSTRKRETHNEDETVR